MPNHVVAPGDTLIRLAQRYGFSDWRTIYDFGANAALRSRCPDPAQLIVGDVVVIPEKRPRDFELPTTVRHHFRARRLRAVFRVVVEDESGRPMGGRKYQLSLDGHTLEGTLAPSGLLELEVNPDPVNGALTVWPDGERGRVLRFNLALGQLPPLSTPAGVRARLANLGFNPGALTGELDAGVAAAVRDFQIVAGLPVTGEVDGATRAALGRAHDKGSP